MNTDLRPYAAMKDPGIPWLGKAPQHWDAKRAKYFFREADDRSTTGEEELLSVSHITGVTPRSEKNIPMFLAESNVGHKLCQPNDIVVNTMWAWMAALGVARQRGIVSPSYAVYRPVKNNGLLPEYVNLLLRTQEYASQYLCASTGVNTSRLRLYPEEFLRIPLLRPPQHEQALILRFLDHAQRRIRRYIGVKHKLVKALEEQKHAIIHRVVTQGVEPDVRFKPSGVEWLSNVPAHWKVAALRHRYSQCLGKMLDSKRITGNHSLPYLRNTDVQWDRINVHGLPNMDIAPDEYDRYTVKTGDLLVCEGGDVGRCALWSHQLDICGFQKALHRLRPHSEAQDVPRFMYYALRAAAKGGAFDDGHQSTIPHLTGEKLRAHRFAFPPRDEQATLVAHLDRSLETLNKAVTTVQTEINLIREYRSRLVADVVTGKLDVREEASRLPDEVDEPESLADADALEGGDEDGVDEDLDAAPNEAEV